MNVFLPLNNTYYDAQDFRSYMAPRTSGVFAAPDHFGATMDGQMMTIDTGIAWIQFDKLQGGTFTINEPITVLCPNLTGQQVARLFFTSDISQNSSNVSFRVGSSLSDPNITRIRNNTVQELAPYDVTLVQGLYVITDNRANSDLCGIMSSEYEQDVSAYMQKGQYALNNKSDQGYVDKAISADGIVGTLPIEQGGTGETNVQDVRTSLEVPYVGDVLTKSNSETYVPVSPYNPATKKYVDDKSFSGDMSKSVFATINPNGGYVDKVVIRSVASNTDLNTLVGEMNYGDWSVDGTTIAQTILNMPIVIAGHLSVKRTTLGGNGTLQEFVPYNNPSSFYRRILHSGNSSPWYVFSQATLLT